MFDTLRSLWLDAKTFVSGIWAIRYKILAAVVVAFALYLFNDYNTWTHTWSLQFHFPVRVSNPQYWFGTIQWQNLFEIQPVTKSEAQANLIRKSEIQTISERLFPKAKAAELKPEDMTNTQYIAYRFKGDAVTAIAVWLAESNGNPYAINKNTDREGTLDLGCWQLNEKWQSFTRAQAFDCKWSTDKALEIHGQWHGFGAWSAYKSGKYLKRFPEARRIVEQNS